MSKIKSLGGVLAISILVASQASAQTASEVLEKGANAVEQGANALGQGVSNLGDKISQTLHSTEELMSNEPSPEAARGRLDDMVAATLPILFEEKPQSQELFDKSVGYAVFDMRKVTLIGAAAGGGRGVAISREDQSRVYMDMATGGVGWGFGVGGFERKLVILFQDSEDFEKFRKNGYDATAEAGSKVGEDGENLDVQFTNGRAIFVLGKNGLRISASLTGTKYWPDEVLN